MPAGPDALSHPIQILIAGVQVIEAEGLSIILGSISPRIVVNSVGAAMRTLVKIVQKKGAHLLVLDDDTLPFPDHAIKYLLRLRPRLKIMVLYSHLLNGKENSYYRAGVRAVFHRSIDANELRSIAVGVLQGKEYILHGEHSNDGNHDEYQGVMDTPYMARIRLRPRERLIIAGMMAGKRNKWIASDINASVQVIKNIFQRIYAKVGVKNKAELASVILGQREVGGEVDDALEETSV